MHSSPLFGSTGILWYSALRLLYRRDTLEGSVRVTSHFSSHWASCPRRCLMYSWDLNRDFQLSNEDSAWAADNTRQNYFLQKILGHGDSLILSEGHVSDEIFKVRKFMTLFLWIKRSLWKIQATGKVFRMLWLPACVLNLKKCILFNMSFSCFPAHYQIGFFLCTLAVGS